MIARYIRSILDCRAGYSAFQVLLPSTSGRVIDLIGPPAVGKSTLIAGLQKNKWLSRRRVCVDYKNVKSPSHLAIFRQEMQSIPDLSLLKTKAHKLHCDALLQQRSIDTGKSYLVDEGISHQFTNSLLNLYDSHRDAFNSLMKHKAIILIEADAKVVISRYANRRSGRRVHWYENKTPEQLCTFIDEVAAKRKELTTKANEAGASTLMINCDEPLEVAIERINSFIRRL